MFACSVLEVRESLEEALPVFWRGVAFLEGAFAVFWRGVAYLGVLAVFLRDMTFWRRCLGVAFLERCL